MDYPLKVAKLRSLNKAQRRARRLGFSKSNWWKSIQAKYATVEIVKQGTEWFLHYNGSSSLTGGFPSKQKAIEWYAKGGR